MSVQKSNSNTGWFNFQSQIVKTKNDVQIRLGSSWSWSYGSWDYNYLCNEWLSPLKFWVQAPLITRCTWYNNMW